MKMKFIIIACLLLFLLLPLLIIKRLYRSQPDRSKPLRSDYTVKDMGTLAGYPIMEASSLNIHGDVAGTAERTQGTSVNDASYRLRAVRWQQGKFNEISNPTVYPDSQAFGINDAGWVVGHLYNANKNNPSHAFLFANNTLRDLGILGGYSSTAYCVNNQQQVVGESEVGPKDETPHAFLWQKGKMQDLDLSHPTTGSIAYAINNRGQVVGGRNDTAFLWQQGKMQDLGTLGGKTSDARSINDQGQVAGVSDISIHNRDYHAFLWQNGKMKDLGSLDGHNSYALSINNRGQIVGFSNAGTGIVHAALWQDGKIIDLNSVVTLEPGWELERATCINSKGQILCWAVRNENVLNKENHAFLLTPIAK